MHSMLTVSERDSNLENSKPDQSTNLKKLKVKVRSDSSSLNLFRIEEGRRGQKGLPPYQFLTVNSANVGISPLKFLT